METHKETAARIAKIAPANFRPELLNLRRRMLGLSQAELAAQSRISQPALSKIEDGLKEPSEYQIEQLAEALRCPVAFFYQSEREYGAPLSTHPMFRKKSAVGVKVLNKFIAEINVRLAHLRALLKPIELDPELPLPQYDADDFEGGAEEVAEMVRRAWYVPNGPIKSLMDYVERAGCVVVSIDIGETQIDGVSYRIPGLPPVIFINSAAPADRQRYSLAHELGHIVMHQIPHPGMEDEANQFAAALLMPKADIFKHLLDATLERIAPLKRVWRVSMAALLVRAKNIGAIDAHKSEYMWRRMSALGYRVHEPAELAFEAERPTVFPALLKNLFEDMGYSAEELEKILFLRFSELSEMYGVARKSGLRRVV